MLKKLTITAILLLALMIIAASAWYGHNYYRSYVFRNIIPAKTQEQLGFPLYIPKSLPNGYSLDKTSISNASNVLTYSVVYDTDKRLIFTLQPRPSEIDTEKFGKERLQNSKDVSLPYVRASIGSLRNMTTASVTTDETWILITAPGGVNDSDLRAIIRGLKSL